jgi:2-polyprenyl-3-methyl-5-hydroxy-6-metoxy-1,4-benzoquinol methylase
MKEHEIDSFRQQASLESAGSSSDAILDNFIKEISKNITDQVSLIDIGCGQGTLLQKVNQICPNASLNGADFTNFKNSPFNFIQHDCNQNFTDSFSSYDIVVASEVIEHLENPRHFLRELSRITKTGGHILLSTPNPESLTSLISFALRGYHSAFGGKSYPAHITAVAPYDLKNMVNEISDLELTEIKFIQNGRMPGLSLHWRQIFPFLKGKRFSDNYMAVISKK